MKIIVRFVALRVKSWAFQTYLLVKDKYKMYLSTNTSSVANNLLFMSIYELYMLLNIDQHFYNLNF